MPSVSCGLFGARCIQWFLALLTIPIKNIPFQQEHLNKEHFSHLPPETRFRPIKSKVLLERAEKSTDERQQKFADAIRSGTFGDVTAHEFGGGISFMSHHGTELQDEFTQLSVRDFDRVMKKIRTDEFDRRDKNADAFATAAETSSSSSEDEHGSRRDTVGWAYILLRLYFF